MSDCSLKNKIIISLNSEVIQIRFMCEDCRQTIHRVNDSRTSMKQLQNEMYFYKICAKSVEQWTEGQSHFCLYGTQTR